MSQLSLLNPQRKKRKELHSFDVPEGCDGALLHLDKRLKSFAAYFSGAGIDTEPLKAI